HLGRKGITANGERLRAEEIGACALDRAGAHAASGQARYVNRAAGIGDEAREASGALVLEECAAAAVLDPDGVDDDGWRFGIALVEKNCVTTILVYEGGARARALVVEKRVTAIVRDGGGELTLTEAR